MSAAGAIDFLNVISQLKDTPRQGWLDMEIPSEKVESVADHMYRMSVMCMMVPDTTLCHDMAEAIVGDISPKMGVPKDEKFRLEKAAIDKMTAMVPEMSGEKFLALWHEYEDQQTVEAHFLRDMDLLEMVVQAGKYELEHDIDLSSFFNSGRKIKHEWACKLRDEVVARRPEKYAKKAE